MATSVPPHHLDILLLSLAGVLTSMKKKRRSRWCKQWLLRRETFSHTNLLSELCFESGDWFNYLRMDQETYHKLLSVVEPLVTKQDTCMRKSVTAHERLTATLRYLATGRSYEDLKYSTAVSAQALGHIIPETCQAIWQTLGKEYLKVSKDVFFKYIYLS